MNPSLSIIIASHNDPEETVLTLKSIRETSPPDVEVVIVDDCSATALHHYIKPDEHTKLITNRLRCGCGPSRHIGALRASGEWLAIMDSHMRMTKSWFDEWASRGSFSGEADKKVVWCATCLGLDSKHMDTEQPVSVYHGATMNLYGPDRNNPKALPQVLEAVWLPKTPEPEDGQETPAIMGAAYFMSREWFLKLAPTRFLRIWGCDEQMISLKTWLAGGSVRLAKNVRIGHKFLLAGKEKQPWGVPPGYVLWNKLFAIYTLLPANMAETLSRLLRNTNSGHDMRAAERMFHDDFYLVAQEQALNRSLFVHNIGWYCSKFQIPLPT